MPALLPPLTPRQEACNKRYAYYRTSSASQPISRSSLATLTLLLAFLTAPVLTPLAWAAPGAKEIQKPLEISGASRKFSLSLTLKSNKDQLETRVRTQYRDKFNRVNF